MFASAGMSSLAVRGNVNSAFASKSWHGTFPTDAVAVLVRWMKTPDIEEPVGFKPERNLKFPSDSVDGLVAGTSTIWFTSVAAQCICELHTKSMAHTVTIAEENLFLPSDSLDLRRTVGVCPLPCELRKNSII